MISIACVFFLGQKKIRGAPVRESAGICFFSLFFRSKTHNYYVIFLKIYILVEQSVFYIYRKFNYFTCVFKKVTKQNIVEWIYLFEKRPVFFIDQHID